jgi:type IV secretory pathway VirB4 component
MEPIVKATTQDHLDIEEIKKDMVILKNGGVCAVLQTTAVNFELLSEVEQDALIAAFSMLLNSITFPIQIVIRSKRLDISKYLDKVIRVENKLTDPLLKKQAVSYRKFVQEVIRRNEVLDKRFYVVIPSGGTKYEQLGASPLDWIGRIMGTHKKRIRVNVDKAIKTAQAELLPKLEHVMGEFNRLGIKSKRLSTQELVELYFDIYNPSSVHSQKIRTNIEDYKTAVVEPAILEE